MLYANGVIFREVKTIDELNHYRGIGCSNWIITDDTIDDYISNVVERAWIDNRYVDCCSDINFIRKYCDILLAFNYDFELLFCFSDKCLPHISEEYFQFTSCLGYDYAYTGGSYYSAIENDICRIPQFENFQEGLNENGLFDTLDYVKQFISVRNSIKEFHNGNMDETLIEDGDFAIYKLYLCKLNYKL